MEQGTTEYGIKTRWLQLKYKIAQIMGTPDWPQMTLDLDLADQPLLQNVDLDLVVLVPSIAFL